MLVPDAEKDDQSGKVSRAANDLAILEEINKEKLSEEGAAISSQLAEVEMKYRSGESKNPVVVNRNLDILEIPANYRDIHVPTVNEAVAKNGKILPYHKKADNRL